MSLGRHYGSVSMAPEVSFGSLAAATGWPDPSGLAWVGTEVNLDSVSYSGQEEPALPLDLQRLNAHRYPPDMEAPWDSAAKLPRQLRRGTLTLSARVRNVGSEVGKTYGTLEAYPLARMLMTAFDVTAAKAADTDAVNGVAIDANHFTATVGGSYAIGDVICCKVNGRVEYTRVTDIVGNVIAVSPAFSTALALGSSHVIRFCRTFYLPTPSGTPAATSVALRYDFQSARFEAVGCRLASLGFAWQQDTLVATLGMRSTWVYDDNSSASPIATVVAKHGTGAPVNPAHKRPSYTVAGGVIGVNVAPHALSRTALTCHDWSATLNPTLAPQPDWSSGRDASEYDVADLDASVEMTCEPNDTVFLASRRSSNLRSYVWGCGPGNEGLGFCLMMGAGFLDSPLDVDMTGSRRLHKVTIKPGAWEGCDASTSLARAPVVFAFPQKEVTP